MCSLWSLWLGCALTGLLAEKFHDIKLDVTHRINYLVVRILQRAYHSSRFLVLGTRAQRKTIKAVIATILQSKAIKVKLFEGVEHTKIVARQCQSDSREHQS